MPCARGEREQPVATLLLARDRVGEVGALAGADLDLGGDQLPGDRVGEHVVALASSARSSNAFTSESVLGSSSPNSSSRPTVKSVEDSNISLGARHRGLDRTLADAGLGRPDFPAKDDPSTSR